MLLTAKSLSLGILANICHQICIYYDSQVLRFVITNSEIKLHILYPMHFASQA